MTLNEIRSRYLAFFKERGHAAIPSSSLLPENDPTTLFTGSGMQPLLPYLLGKDHPEGTRLVDSQKCFRAMDIEEVGDNRHTTFFEMLGNWSLGDYFKTEQLPWVFDFLTDPERGVGLDPSRLYVTAFLGDEKNDIPRDTESAALWRALFAKAGIEAKEAAMGSEADGGERGMKEGERIFYYDASKNWWSRSGTPERMPAGEPGGPDSEMFYDFGVPHDEKFGRHCHPNCDCGRFLEIGNSVFMQYVKREDGTFDLLPKKNVDFGGGLERIAAASQNDADIFATDVFEALKNAIAERTGKAYEDPAYQTSFRIVLDHLRAALFLIGDNVRPSKKDAGYMLRHIIRRAVFHLDRLGLEKKALAELVHILVERYEGSYPELRERRAAIVETLEAEEADFRKTLRNGLKQFEELARLTRGISGYDAFVLSSTYGFPLELMQELAAERGMTIDLDGYAAEMKKHQELSRAGGEQKFRGGLADTAEKTVRLHTAHHLLLKALQLVLGPEVHQRGSNITQERLRIDFAHNAKLTDGEKREIERIVNEKIAEDLPVIRSEMTRDEAERLGAEHEFGQKYPERVSVYSVGPAEATEQSPRYESAYSIEFCGGPHVAHTGELAAGGKRFKIQKEEAVAQGIRRIKAVLE